MRLLLPAAAAADEALDDLYRELSWPSPPEGRPHVYLDLVASVDGAATVDGRTERLGGEADHLAFRRLREWCDAILIGASTVRIEDYGPPRPDASARERRRARGLAPRPELVIVTARAALEPTARVFQDTADRPVVLTSTSALPDRVQALGDVAEVVQVGVGTGGIDLAEGLALLHRRGIRRLLCEGGPTLNAHLFAADLVDEVFLTIAPCVVGGDALRIVNGELARGPRGLELAELRVHEHELLLRYRAAGRDGALRGGGEGAR